MAKVQTKRKESYAVENNSSLCNPGSDIHSHITLQPKAKLEEVLLKLSVISFESDCHQDAVLSALDSAVQNGHWLVLNNCHLLDCWDVRVVNKLTQVVYSTTKDLETDGKLLNAGGTERFVHPQFKLWLITKGDRPHSVPVAVRIRALHLVCDSSWDLKDELWSSVKQTLPFFSHEDTVNTRCVVLHSVLLQRQTFKHLGQGRLYLWTREDLLALIDAHHCITKHCSDPTAAVEYIADSLQPVKYNMTSSTAAYLTSSALLRLETRAAQVIPVGGVIRRLQERNSSRHSISTQLLQVDQVERSILLLAESQSRWNGRQTFTSFIKPLLFSPSLFITLSLFHPVPLQSAVPFRTIE
ncbi:hypothetical protein QQF64_003537 [Cirrhinus molitorella]|uniref:Dynein heavy chain region D6 P-loop domain-containing protein n=1 Tax=Cirrhinus molitorella TaxID=172907 RepID=A0ABR3MLL4_9TELE